MKLCCTCKSNEAPSYQSQCHRCHDFVRRSDPRWRLRRAAHSSAAQALKSGILVRQPCEVCGDPAEMHHDDHTRPLDVRWRCGFHHHAVHGQLATQENTPFVFQPRRFPES